MYERAKYYDTSKKTWRQLPDKDTVGTLKYDGASYFMRVENDGSLRFFSRRPSVKGGFPERTSSLPHLTEKKLPEYAGHVYNVELIHTGHDPATVESHPRVSGILNSLPEKSVATQQELGPVRAVLHNVIYPELPTYRDKLLQMKKVQDSFGNPDVLKVVEPHLGHKAIDKLIDKTQRRGQEGVIITSLNTPEEGNVRYKHKHMEYHNLKISGFKEAVDKSGKPKGEMGAVTAVDRNGKEVAEVGTGWSSEQRKDIWRNPTKYIGELIQVKSMGLAKNKLRSPVYNGTADGEWDVVA